MYDALYPREPSGINKAPVFVPQAPPDTSIWAGAGKGAGLGLMQSFAKTGRNAAMAAAVPAIVVDELTRQGAGLVRAIGGALGADVEQVQGTTLADKVFGAVDDVFNPAVKFWEPKPDEIGAAGQVLGALAGMGASAMTGGASGLVANETMSMAMELTEKGASPVTAVLGGVSRGTTTAVGLALPAALLPSRLGSAAAGAVVNPVIGVYDRTVLSKILESEGLHKAAESYKPLDPVQLSIDAAFGTVFGAAFGGKVKAPKGKKPAANLPGVLEPKPDTPLLREAAQTVLLREEGAKGRLEPADIWEAERSQQLNANAEARALAGEPLVIHPDTPLDAKALKAAVDRVDEGLRVVEDAPIRDNASRYGAASDEAIDRLRRELAAGQTRAVISRDTYSPLNTVDGVDRQAKGGEIIVQRGIGKDPDGWTVISHDGASKGAQARAIEIAKRNWKAAEPSPPEPPAKIAEPETQVVDFDEFVKAQGGNEPPPPVSKAETAPPRGAAQIEAAQKAAEQISMGGKSLKEVIEQGLPNDVRNLVVGLAEAHGSPGKAKRLLDDFQRAVQAQPGRPTADIAADVVEASRAGRTATPEPKAPPEIEAARAAVAENPDMRIPVGEDGQGNAISRRAADALEDAEREIAQATNDAKAFMAAANCFLRG